MDTYYDEILKGVDELIEQQDYKEAFSILENELSIPYISKEFEDQLIEKYNFCRSRLHFQNSQKSYTVEDVENLFTQSIDEQFIAIEYLKKSNIRQHLEVVEKVLCSNTIRLIKSLLIEVLIEQNVTQEMQMREGEFDITFIPCYIELPTKSEGVLQAMEYIAEWFENENPSFLRLCMESLVKESYLRLPINIEEEESLELAIAIVEYVYIAYNAKEDFYQFLENKQLTQKKKFELLLNEL